MGKGVDGTAGVGRRCRITFWDMGETGVRHMGEMGLTSAGEREHRLEPAIDVRVVGTHLKRIKCLPKSERERER